MQSATNCPRCGQPLTYVYQYQQWYCPAEGVYPWATAQAQQTPQAQQAPAQAAPAPKAEAAPKAAEAAKPAEPQPAQAVPQATASHACPRCGKPLSYVNQYQQWYCPAEGVYPWATAQAQQTPQAQQAAQPVQQAAQPAQQAAAGQACPRCGQALTYVYQYQRWYCPSEGVYPWG